MTDDSSYVCERCGESFDSPAKKGGHMVKHNQRIHPIEKLLAIRELAAELGRAPTQQEMDDQGSISYYTVLDEFGTWNDAVKAAGLEPVHRHSIPREDILDAIRALAERLGHAPSQQTMVEEGAVSIDAAAAKFGSWTDAVRAAGYVPVSEAISKGHLPNWDVSTTEIIAAIRNLADTKDRAPCASEMIEEGAIWPGLIRSRFGSYDKGIRAAGFEPYHPKQANKATESELIEAIHDLATELGRVPTIRAMETDGSYSPSLVETRFGSWNEGLRQAGFEPNLRRDIPDEELLADIDRLESELGHPPRCMEYHRRGMFSVQSFHDRFGDWTEVLGAAGYEHPGPKTGVKHHSWKGPEEWPRGCRYYGANWAEQRRRTLERDNYICQTPGCSITDEQHREKYHTGLHVHHLQPLRTFFNQGGINYDKANALDNLVSVCVTHHKRWEAAAPGRPDFE
ncbi:homing endonuclease associated repeat-containing protein [Halorarius litoreus]|uniref:homing endonuclease associated repeat-containing protein n=1 Tax=Halorarius litoreus TaxID=2962676 RepID=UPI0020CE758E|nr:hypothetical protein [Halorarius litoreus]